MKNLSTVQMTEHLSATAPCPLFGECGGCQYQDKAYETELNIKQKQMEQLFCSSSVSCAEQLEYIVPSPKVYNYRCRLDMRLLKTKDNRVFIGFTPTAGYRVVAAEACPIALEALSEAIPRIKEEAVSRLPEKYRNANLTIKTGDDGRVFWGGIGKRSLRMNEEDYLWTIVNGKRIFYSLEAFFQANLSVLPVLIKRIESFGIITPSSILYDFYGGVGLFSIAFFDKVSRVVLVEENIHAVKLAEFNKAYHQCRNINIIPGRVEDQLRDFPVRGLKHGDIAIVDPPRSGLNDSALKALSQTHSFPHLLYLSCNPSVLARDMSILIRNHWKVCKIIPFDFFPRTKHIEVLCWLTKSS